MKKITLKISSEPKVEEVFARYPDSVRSKMIKLRQLVLEAAEEIDNLEKLEETLK